MRNMLRGIIIKSGGSKKTRKNTKDNELLWRIESGYVNGKKDPSSSSSISSAEMKYFHEKEYYNNIVVARTKCGYKIYPVVYHDCGTYHIHS